MDIRPLTPKDDRSTFHSGDDDLDRFFHAYAGQNQFRHHLGTTYIAVEGSRILGYATVAAGHIEIEDIPQPALKRLPRYPLPILRLARLATAVSTRNEGAGTALLRFVFTLALRMSDAYGCVGVVVDAKPGAQEFYSRLGFTPLEAIEGALSSKPRPIPMFLSIREIDDATRKTQK